MTDAPSIRSDSLPDMSSPARSYNFRPPPESATANIFAQTLDRLPGTSGYDSDQVQHVFEHLLHALDDARKQNAIYTDFALAMEAQLHDSTPGSGRQHSERAETRRETVARRQEEDVERDMKTQEGEAEINEQPTQPPAAPATEEIIEHDGAVRLLSLNPLEHLQERPARPVTKLSADSEGDLDKKEKENTTQHPPPPVPEDDDVSALRQQMASLQVRLTAAEKKSKVLPPSDTPETPVSEEVQLPPAVQHQIRQLQLENESLTTSRDSLARQCAYLKTKLTAIDKKTQGTPEKEDEYPDPAQSCSKALASHDNPGLVDIQQQLNEVRIENVSLTVERNMMSDIFMEIMKQEMEEIMLNRDREYAAEVEHWKTLGECQRRYLSLRIDELNESKLVAEAEVRKLRKNIAIQEGSMADHDRAKRVLSSTMEAIFTPGAYIDNIDPSLFSSLLPPMFSLVLQFKRLWDIRWGDRHIGYDYVGMSPSRYEILTIAELLLWSRGISVPAVFKNEVDQVIWLEYNVVRVATSGVSRKDISVMLAFALLDQKTKSNDPLARCIAYCSLYRLTGSFELRDKAGWEQYVTTLYSNHPDLHADPLAQAFLACLARTVSHPETLLSPKLSTAFLTDLRFSPLAFIPVNEVLHLLAFTKLGVTWNGHSLVRQHDIDVIFCGIKPPAYKWRFMMGPLSLKKYASGIYQLVHGYDSKHLDLMLTSSPERLGDHLTAYGYMLRYYPGEFQAADDRYIKGEVAQFPKDEAAQVDCILKTRRTDARAEAFLASRLTCLGQSSEPIQMT